MPLSTEHQGVCSYSPNQILCPLPSSPTSAKLSSSFLASSTCRSNSNHPQSHYKFRYNTSSLCGEMEFSIERQKSYTSIPPVNIE